MSRRAAVFLAAVLVAAAGCRVRAPYSAPVAPRPPAYSEQPPQSFKESQDWKTANPADALHRGRWWEVFHDPDLNALEERVDVSNRNLMSAEAHFRQARAFIGEPRSARFPTLAGGANITRERLSLNRPGPSLQGHNTANDFMLPVDVSYEPDVWGRVRNLVASAGQNAQASAADLESTRLSLHAELALDYFDLRVLDQEQKLLADSVTAYSRALDLTRRRFEGGVANRADVAQAETQLAATQAQAIDVTERRAQFEHALAVLSGRTPEEFWLPVKLYPLSPPVIPTGVPSTLLERRPDIAAAERRVASANSQVGVARAAFYPQVLLNAAGGFEGSSFANWLAWPSRLWAVGPSALETVFDAGRRRAVVEEATAYYEATIADYRQNVLTAFQQVEDTLASLRILEDEAQRQQLAVEAAQRSEELSMNRYKGGLVTYLEVATTQTVALQNERVAVDITRRRMEASVLLIKALGGGWDAATLPQFSGAATSPRTARSDPRPD